MNAAIDRNLSEADKKARDVGRVIAFANSDNGVKVNGYYRTASLRFERHERQIAKLEGEARTLPLRRDVLNERQSKIRDEMVATLMYYDKRAGDVVKASGKELEAITNTTNRASFEQKQMAIDVHEELRGVYERRENALQDTYRNLWSRLNKIK